MVDETMKDEITNVVDVEDRTTMGSVRLMECNADYVKG